MSIKGQGHFLTIYFQVLYVLCFTMYLAKISVERLQDHWSSGITFILAGWSAVSPQETVQHYGIPCSELCVNDVCLPPSHPDAAFSKEVFKSFEE